MRYGALRSAPFRGVLVMGAGLLLLATFLAAPAFTHSSAAAIPPGSSAFTALWSSIEPVVPNFWGPAVQPALMEPYQDATNGSRLVQYFDKARMEQTTADGPVTNGLLTVEMITGQRQMGDTKFATFPPSTLPIVGDQTNAFPTYASFGGTVFAAKVSKSGAPTGTVYKPDGTFGLNPGLAADPGAAFGSYLADPGNRFAHNIPLAFTAYLAALPVPSLSVMGYPLTEAVWVNVTLNGTPTWVLVQPFERRVLSYTPTNPPAFQVEMGNIGQHYFQWRYAANTGSNDVHGTGTATITMTGTPATGTPATGTPATGTSITGTPTTGTPTRTRTGTPTALTISSVQLGTVTESAFSLTFKTSIAATSEILYGTASHSYTARQDVSTTAVQDHAVNLTGLEPGRKYYFVLRATSGGTSVEGKEDFFTTTGKAAATGIALSPTATKTPKPTTTTPTSTPKPSTATATMQPRFVRLTLSQVTVGAGSPAQLGDSVVALDSTTVALSFAYDGSSNAVTDTARPTNWVRDPTNATASSNSPSNPLSLTDKQTTLMLTATATIPFVDTTSPPLVVTFSRRVSPSDYAAGITITSPALSNAHAPGYNVTLTFAVALDG